MVRRYTSTVIVAADSTLNLWRIWGVWSNIPEMPRWDKDCESARLESTLDEGKILYISMKNKPKVENKCVLSKLVPPNNSSPSETKFHFVFALPLAKLSFQYEAAIVGSSNDICLTHSTEIVGLMSGLYWYALKDAIAAGCDHMSSSVPALARTLQVEEQTESK